MEGGLDVEGVKRTSQVPKRKVDDTGLGDTVGTEESTGVDP